MADKLIKDGGRGDLSVIDVGCGSGLLGLGIKHLNPGIRLTLSDTAKDALKVARLNSKRSGLSAAFRHGRLLGEDTYDMVVANLPTFTPKDMARFPLHGPEEAYSSTSPDPLYLYEQLFAQAKDRCKVLICECQGQYQKKMLALATSLGWVLILRSGSSFAWLPKRLS